MLQRLTGMLQMRRSEERRTVAQIPDGERVYAIGDIHGRKDLLQQLLTMLKADAADFKGKITLVGIGDYIDRGPDSKGVVDTLLAEIPTGWEKIFLRGNHEQAMLDFMDAPLLRGEWLAWGGIQAMESYGVAPYGARGMRDSAALAAEFSQTLEENGHDAFYKATRLSFTCGDYLFVHAGVRPGVPADKQMADDLLFIRDDFIGREHHLPYRVVFGHTILEEPLMADDRIGLDTGAFQSNVLTAVRLEGETATILQAKP